MHSDDAVRELGDLLNGASTSLDRAFPLRWQTFPRIEIVRADDKPMAIKASSPGRKAEATWAKAGGRLLTDFADLARHGDSLDAFATAVQRYASRYGLLGVLCEHGRFPSSPKHAKCAPAMTERLSIWSAYVRQASAILLATAQVNQDLDVSEDTLRAVMLLPRSQPLQRDAVRVEREIGLAVSRWVSGISPVLSWLPKHAPRIEFFGWRRGGLLGALGLELALAICRQPDFYVCSGCGIPFTKAARQRAPKQGQRAFCPKCQNDGTIFRVARRGKKR